MQSYSRVHMERYGVRRRKISQWLIVGHKINGYTDKRIFDVSDESILGESFRLILEDAEGRSHNFSNNQEPGAPSYYVNPDGKIDRVPSEIAQITYKDWRVSFSNI